MPLLWGWESHVVSLVSVVWPQSDIGTSGSVSSILIIGLAVCNDTNITSAPTLRRITISHFEVKRESSI
jgi:hypothetical protein